MELYNGNLHHGTGFMNVYGEKSRKTKTLDKSSTIKQFFYRVGGQHILVFRLGIYSWSICLKGGTIKPGARDDYVLGVDMPTPMNCIFLAVPNGLPDDTRTNVFCIQETITGNGYIFTIGYCPIFNIDSYVILSTPIVSPDSLTLETIWYRISDYARTFGHLKSSSVPTYACYSLTKNLDIDLYVPVTMPKIRGQQTIIVKSTREFSFDVDYGQPADSYYNPCSPVISPTIEDVIGATVVEEVIPNGKRYSFTTPDGRVYMIQFYKLDIAPTIALDPLSPVVGGLIEVIVSTKYYDNV